MQIHTSGLYKRFNSNYIIKDLSVQFNEHICYGISGANGSGKTTLINLLAGLLMPTKGSIIYFDHQQELNLEKAISKMSFAAPYAALLEYYTLIEYLDFYSTFKKIKISNPEFLHLVNLSDRANDAISSFSSGMKQRLKLALALKSDVDIVFLDEPISFLDEVYQTWFYNLLSIEKKDKTIIISSNEKADFELVDQIIKL